ncbi:membrane-associated tyrosine- and threonine-specific cdc2-inhibitory kinase [Drosophila willistoni]|uniref:membrane-associated tyrosine- and threonine-specific cdc2-inhibitory kinase n=1 Tax=Drosophila willistoni TaxID=7260 RepID=UPI000C26DA62|nr:membrane-associated tyrosine- and threonine-specific cdc2-inhibitory kinase [Drosophila willistoni]
MDMHSLPVPDLRDDKKHREKQFHGHENSNRFRPPKYKARGSYVMGENNNLNRSSSVGLSLTAGTSAAGVGGGGSGTGGGCPGGGGGSPYNFNNTSQLAHAISFRETNSSSPSHSLPLIANNNEDVDANSSSSFGNSSHFELCFERLAKLGEGSFGEVFQVRDRSDGQMYAVKISKQLFRGEQYRSERLEEVRRYEQFSGHENCIRFIRAWEQYDRLFMQMELCRESLEQYLCRCQHQIAEERIWHILLDLLRGLKSLHDRNLIHLDIKLDNVLIGEDEETCKLADFGLVIDVDKANSHHATEGDSRYMAPEILQGQFSKAADIFSLGIAMLELACYMDLPSNGPLWHELRQGILPEEFIDKISVELQQVIKSMMTPDPQQRPTVEELLNHPRLQQMQQREKSLMTFNYLSKSFRRSSRYFWLKMCNLKIWAYRYIFYFLEILHIHKPLKLPMASKQTDSLKPTPYPPSSPSNGNANPNPHPNTNNQLSNTPIMPVPDIELQLVGSTPIANRDYYTSDFLTREDAFDISPQGSPGIAINSTPLNHKHRDKSLNSSRNLRSWSFNHILVDQNNVSLPKSLNNTSFLRKKLFVMDSDEEE